MINDKIENWCPMNEPEEWDISDISEIHEEYARRNLNKITELLSQAQKEILILGLVGYGPIHESPNEIINLINNRKGIVKILIGNPKSDYFIDRMLREKDEQKSSLHQYNAAYAEIAHIYSQLSNENQFNLQIREYTDLECDLSLQIIDQMEMYVNIRKNADGLRCFDSPMFKIYRKRLAQKLSFNFYFGLFEKVWNDPSTNVVDLYEKKWRSICKNGKHEKIPLGDY